jgi:tetratricopeptide (TPR) repeat protein
MSQDAEYYFQRSLEKSHEEDTQAALADLDKAIELNPKTSTYYRRRAYLRYRYFKQYFLALEDFNKVVELEPENLKFYFERGLFKYDFLSQYLPAIEDFTKVIQNSQDLDDLESAHHSRLHCYRSKGQIAAFLKDLDWIIEHGFGTANLYDWRGEYKRRMWLFEDAVKDHTAAYELSPNKGSLIERAQAYYYLKQYDNALRDLTQIITSDEEHHPSYLSNVYIWRGSVYYMAGQKQEAFRDFEEAIRLSNLSISSVQQYMETYGLPPDLPEKLEIT